MGGNCSEVEGTCVGWATPFSSTVAVVGGGRVKRRPPYVAAMVDEQSVIHPTSAQRGFSLLELLVVLFIAGLLTSLGVAWLDSGAAPAQQALERLAAASRAQAAEALHAGQIRGLRWNGQRPEFVRQVRDREGLRWQVEAVALGEWPRLLRPDWPAAGEPRLLFTPNGVGPAQALRWHWPEGGEQWQWDSTGRLLRTSLP